ncbi:TIM-barrel domain-containing protein [Streptomyces shenzhenensis]|uniref:TIM-barrel domain-containing protein n=1 Tax=Streptomyces shenzhenensis TaxID=943815 RepID=UPI0033C0E45E
MASDWFVPGAQQPRFVADLPSLDERLGPDPRRVHPRLHSVVECEGPAVRIRLTEGQDSVAVTVAAISDGVLQVKIGADWDTTTRSQSSWPLLTPPSAPWPLDARLTGPGAVVDAGSARAEIVFEPFHIRVLDSSGRLLVEQQQHDAYATGSPRGIPLGYVEGVNGRVYADMLRSRPDEHYFGLGESSTEFDKRGQRAVSWTMDSYGVGSERSYKPVPFVYSTAGYGLLVNSGLPVSMDLAKASASTLGLAVEDDVLDYYILAGPQPRDVLRRYQELTSPTVLPPVWALGVWMSTGFLPQTQASVEAWLEQAVEHEFPVEVVHIDPYWMRFGCWSDLEWDREAFPDPRGMLAKLRQAGIRTCLWINPYIGTDSEQFRHGAEHGYFLTDENGRTWTGAVWGDDVDHSPVAIVDFTNPEATAWFQARLRRLLEDGVAVIKTDFGEGVPPDIRAHNGVGGLELHNVYPLLYNEAVADITEEVHGYRLVWARASYLGGQRHTAQWGGDTATTWEGMASTLRAGLSYAMSGYSFWSHDTGGFDGRPTPELFMRWAQFGFLSPLSRLHGTTSRIPWEWDEHVFDTVKAMAILRYQLLPYIWSQAVTSVRDIAPLLRPAVFDEPTNHSTWIADGNYRLGEDLMVAPVRDEDGRLNAYLPHGEWIEWESHAVHTGPTFLQHINELRSDLPLLVRANSIVPTWDARHTPAEDFDNVVLQLWRPAQGTTTALIHGVHASTDVTITAVDGTIDVVLEGPLPLTRINVLAAAEPVSAITVNGRPWVPAGDTSWTAC